VNGAGQVSQARAEVCRVSGRPVMLWKKGSHKKLKKMTFSLGLIKEVNFCDFSLTKP
jgi:hypothetical protein